MWGSVGSEGCVREGMGYVVWGVVCGLEEGGWCGVGCCVRGQREGCRGDGARVYPLAFGEGVF